MQCASSIKHPSAPRAGLHLQASFSSGQPGNTQPPTPSCLNILLPHIQPDLFRASLNLDPADKLTQKLEFATQTYRIRVQSSSI